MPHDGHAGPGDGVLPPYTPVARVHAAEIVGARGQGRTGTGSPKAKANALRREADGSDGHRAMFCIRRMRRADGILRWVDSENGQRDVAGLHAREGGKATL